MPCWPGRNDAPIPTFSLALPAPRSLDIEKPLGEGNRQEVIADHDTLTNIVNGVVVNLPQFQRAFACKTGQPMAPANRCAIW